MQKSTLVECVRLLSIDNINDPKYATIIEPKLIEAYTKLQINHEEVVSVVANIAARNFSETVTVEWKYVCLSLYLIKSLLDLTEKSDEIFLSVKETKDFKKFLRTLVHIGICTKLQPNLPFYSKSGFPESDDIFLNYNILKSTTFGLVDFLKIPVFRFSLIPEGFKEILVALYQLSYCPLKKPTSTITGGMTIEIYKKLLQEQELFRTILEHLKQTVHPSIFVKNTMAILHKNSPIWFKKHVSLALTGILRSENGVELVSVALFGDHENDSTRTWKILDVFSKLILSCKKFPDFKDNICKQLIGLLHKQEEENSFIDNVFAHCAKKFYKEDEETCRTVFIREIITPFVHFTYKSRTVADGNITSRIERTSRLLHAVFVENTQDEDAVPAVILQPVINVVYKFYVLTTNSSFKSLNNDLKDILLLYLENQQEHYIRIFDRILFDLDCSEILPFRNDISVKIDVDRIQLRKLEHSIKYSSVENCECLLKLLENKPNLLTLFFCYLLNCICNEHKYFPRGNEDLLRLEDDLTSEYFERKIVVYKVLSQISEEKCIQKQLNENPTDLIRYINNVLDKTIQLKTHLVQDADSEGFQSVFTILMILENLLSNSQKSSHTSFELLSGLLIKIHSETPNTEMKDIIGKILKLIEKGDTNIPKIKLKVKSDLDKAIDDICDPMLPTRGHGLLTLTKLIEKKDKNTMERKQFVLNLLQQNLTNKDSFIYLTAINGLAAMADHFPDTILSILCEEYSDSNRKDSEDNAEIRMKIGEVLVKVTKVLGEMAPKHKPLLLNTFLSGTKDHDDLIRSSSLSNLGEICRVLGYKLGTMFTEVLVCVHSIISTDKSPQARRAAVTVIRQLFVGLDQEIIAFFKDDILPVYRTLKHIYNSDKDDVMRLQAQLALEELNESMKNFVFPKPELNFDKKIVMLD
ncbi:unnamed protein product [Phyllotreta striolata]|uniref:Uncharacterized protein n=1 Tax=Phyllotreta striolata TaxID=444603 RepID=A0A9N9TDR1_PHYSR|nr:unnamed protein product [Phyllotreta striolata]